LVACDCFEYPVVDGVLLLSLSKGYGGPEERYQPYQALLAASIHYLQKRDQDGLLAWLRKHIPHIHQMITGTAPDSYAGFIARHQRLFDKAFALALQQDSRWDVLGWNEERRRGSRFGRPMTALLSTRAGVELLSRLHGLLRKPQDYWYFQRWLDGRLARTRTALSCWPVVSPILSLACGHGIAETLIGHLDGDAEIVSVDGQITNVWVTKTYVAPNATYIVHDLSMPLPFADAHFGMTFCSTSFQEIPAHFTFASEKIRVTRPEGVAYFDHAWWWEPRVSPLRAYRYCQNMIGSPSATARLLKRAAGARMVYSTPLEGFEPRSIPWSPTWRECSVDEESGPDDLARDRQPGIGYSFAVAAERPRNPSLPDRLTNLYRNPLDPAQVAISPVPHEGEPAGMMAEEDRRRLELALHNREAFVLPARFAGHMRPV